MLIPPMAILLEESPYRNIHNEVIVVAIFQLAVRVSVHIVTDVLRRES
tara:strand:+ start:331 stop:474 length:144 start_codon:yes stop_codon:yes gene_type:complete